jgi:threonine/homoserine/homoserine lactone efflux protein
VGEAQERSSHGFFWQAFMVTITNPKILVLYGMIIPPFLSREGNPTLETFLLGASFVLIASFTDSGTCLAAGGVWMALRGR